MFDVAGAAAVVEHDHDGIGVLGSAAVATAAAAASIYYQAPMVLSAGQKSSF